MFVPLAHVEPLRTRIESLTTRIADSRLHIETTRAPSQTVLAISSDVLFAFDSTRVRPAAKASLGVVRSQVAGGCVTIVGDTDSRGTRKYNLALSRRRADAVREALHVPCATTSGRGESHPAAPNRT